MVIERYRVAVLMSAPRVEKFLFPGQVHDPAGKKRQLRRDISAATDRFDPDLSCAEFRAALHRGASSVPCVDCVMLFAVSSSVAIMRCRAASRAVILCRKFLR